MLDRFYISDQRWVLNGGTSFYGRSVEGLRSGSPHRLPAPYVSDLQSHSAGPKRKRCSHSVLNAASSAKTRDRDDDAVHRPDLPEPHRIAREQQIDDGDLDQVVRERHAARAGEDAEVRHDRRGELAMNRSATLTYVNVSH